MIEAIQRYLYVVIAMLPFEIGDMKYDSIKLSTIPQRIGIARTKVLDVYVIDYVFAWNFLRMNFT